MNTISRTLTTASLLLTLSAVPTFAVAQDAADTQDTVEATDTVTPAIAEAIETIEAALEAGDYRGVFNTFLSIPLDQIQTDIDRDAIMSVARSFRTLEPEALNGLLEAQAAIFEENEDAQQQMQALQDALVPQDPLLGTFPEFSYTLLDGTTYNQDDLRGGVVVLDFWATWCGPCIASMPHMAELAEQYPNVTMVGVSLDDTREMLDAWMSGNSTPWPVAHNGSGYQDPMVQTFQIRGIPSVFILSPTGEVLWKGHPMEMDQPLADIMAEHGS